MADENDKKRKAVDGGAPKTPPNFLPKLLGKKVTLRMAGGGQPITGTFEGFNSYELRVTVGGKEYIVFKHAVATIEVI